MTFERLKKAVESTAIAFTYHAISLTSLALHYNFRRDHVPTGIVPYQSMHGDVVFDPEKNRLIVFGAGASFYDNGEPVVLNDGEDSGNVLTGGYFKPNRGMSQGISIPLNQTKRSSYIRKTGAEARWSESAEKHHPSAQIIYNLEKLRDEAAAGKSRHLQNRIAYFRSIFFQNSKLILPESGKIIIDEIPFRRAPLSFVIDLRTMSYYMNTTKADLFSDPKAQYYVLKQILRLLIGSANADGDFTLRIENWSKDDNHDVTKRGMAIVSYNPKKIVMSGALSNSVKDRPVDGLLFKPTRVIKDAAAGKIIPFYIPEFKLRNHHLGQ